MALHYATLVERSRLTTSILGLWEFACPFSGRLTRVSFSSSSDAGAGGAEFDVRRNGVSLFASGQPAILEGERSVAVDVSYTVGAGDRVEVDLSAVGAEGVGESVYAVLTFDDELGGGGGSLDAAAVRAVVAEMLQAGANVTLDYDAAAGTLTINASGGAPALTLEDVDDRVASLIVAGTNITKTYDDAAGTLILSAAGGGEVLPATAVTEGGETVTENGETVTEG
ncbi:MAG: hypothetical protein MSG64_16645 [Pyrinomonadaceae bacterium MAG19_C2-C3]|nr:hypothetical protein [Pyrinomonadaceae bacterium MAG19_C2-C3]